jgi:HJR/Mrr/RecB family endonuclease
MSVRIAKADGTTEEFKPQKLLSSLERSGADKNIAEQVEREVEKELYDGISTQEIYTHAFSRLRTEHRSSAARYSLKRAILEFGPSGFPFESYLAELFRAEGYEAKVDQIIKGKCVEHEVDVVATKNGETTYVEAKFHNTPGFKSDLQTVLYVEARVEDIGGKGLVVTNTKFTDKAMQYAECRGLELLAWDYPQGATLHERIDKAGIYPVTALTTLSKREKMALLGERKVLCTALPLETEALSRVGISGKKAQMVLEEVGALCVPGRDI